MKNARAVLAALLVACCARSSLAVDRAAVVQIRSQEEIAASGGSTGPFLASNKQIGWGATLSFLNRFNPGGYDIYNDQSHIRSTGLAATGVVGGSPHSLVVWVGPRKINNSNQYGGALRNPDSLIWNAFPLNGSAMAGYVPTVPHLMIDVPKGEIYSATTYNGANAESFDPANEAPGYGGARLKLHGSNYVWGMAVGGMAAVPDSKLASGGNADGFGAGGIGDSSLRVVIGMHASNWVNAPYSAGRIPPAFRDSLYSDTTASVLFQNAWGGYITAFPNGAYGNSLWIDYGFTNGSSRRPLIYDHWMATGTTMAGGQSASNDHRSLGAYEVLYAGLAQADSICGRCLLGENVEPIRVAIQISDGTKLGGAFLGGGLSPADTSAQMSNAVDSLASLGVPFTVGIDPDSMRFHAGMLNNWKRAGMAHFAAQPVFDSTTAGGENATPNRPLDPIGIMRVRKWLGPNTGNAADTSSYALLARTYAILDSAFGSARVDRVWMGQKDDWSPAGVGRQNQAAMDSLLYVMSLLNIAGVSCDAEADSEATATSGRGIPGRQRVLTNSIDRSRKLLALCFPGYNPRGATRGNGRDSSFAPFVVFKKGPNDSTFATHYMQRAMMGMAQPYWYLPQDRAKLQTTGTLGNATGGGGYNHWLGEYLMSGQISDKATRNTGTNLIRISASGLGSGEWGTLSPNMPGWYQLKYIVNACKAINQIAGRTLIAFVYPQDLSEKDIKR